MLVPFSARVAWKTLTPREVRSNIFGSDVGCHRDDGHMLIHSPDIYRRRYSVNDGHNDVHEYEIVAIGVLVNDIRCLLAIFLFGKSAPFSTTTWGRVLTARSTEHSI